MIGMRAWLEVLGREAFPSVKSRTPKGEVAAAFTGILKILSGKGRRGRKSWAGWHYESTLGNGRLARGLGELSTQYAVLSTQWRWRISNGLAPGRSRLLQEFLQVFPVDQDYVIFFEELFEFGAGHYIVVALAPGGSVVEVIDGDGLEFGVVVGQVDDDFG